MKFIIFFYLLSFLYFNGLSQDIIIKGYIKDSISNEPVELANIYILNNKKIGTISNEDGRFYLKTKKIDTLVFSHLNYKTAFLPVNKLYNTVNLKLVKIPSLLNEIIVNPNFNLKQIITKASQNLKNNHYHKPMFYQVFVQSWETTDKNLDVYEEFALHLYQEIPLPKFKIIKGRSMAFSEIAMEKFEKRKLYNIIDIYADYPFLFLSPFLKEKNYDKYDYKLLGKIKIDNHDCYHVLCNPKNNNDTINLYIEKNTYGIARIEEILSKEEKYIAKSNIIINYININGKWYLKSSKYSYIPKRNLKKCIERLSFYSIISVESKKDYENFKKVIKTPIYKYTSNFEDNFWQRNNFIPIPKQIRKQMK